MKTPGYDSVKDSNICLHIMANLWCIILAIILGFSSQASGNAAYRQIIEKISEQLLESDGKVVADCDAILVSSPGKILTLDSTTLFRTRHIKTKDRTKRPLRQSSPRHLPPGQSDAGA